MSLSFITIGTGICPGQTAFHLLDVSTKKISPLLFWSWFGHVEDQTTQEGCPIEITQQRFNEFRLVGWSPESRDKGVDVLTIRKQFHPITAKLRPKIAKISLHSHSFANNSKTATDIWILIGFASPLLNTAVILRPNSICFRSTVCQKNNQSQRTITFLPVSAKPLMLAWIWLAPPPLIDAFWIRWSSYKANSTKPLPHYANELPLKTLKPSES